MEKEKIYGLSEGVLKACEFLGLTLPPPSAVNLSKDDGDALERFPSDYFGENFELSLDLMNKLQRASKLTKEKFSQTYGAFTKKFFSQKPLKQNETNLNVYFCDFLLFVRSIDDSSTDYFDFEYYRKSSLTQKTFIPQKFRRRLIAIANDVCYVPTLNIKTLANKLFSDFLHRDWLNTEECSFEEFKFFVGKNPRFFSKPIAGSLGKGTEIIQVNEHENLKRLLENLKEKRSLLEGVIRQHESLNEFCPDTVNTVRVNTFLDVHNVVHILTACGRFGRVGNIVDNFHGGGFAVTIDPKTGVIISDGINKVHERAKIHPDTGKAFRGFQYPCWEEFREDITKMAKLLPQCRHVGWDIVINSEGKATFIEGNTRPDVDVQQAPDSVGRFHLYQSLVEELEKYQEEEMARLGYRVNNLRNFHKRYNNPPARKGDRLQLAVSKIVPNCKSLMDVGCRKSQFVKSICPENVKYIPVDCINYGNQNIIVWDFNKEEPLDIKADTCLLAFTAEYAGHLPQFLSVVCQAAQKQILMICRPYDREIDRKHRWKYSFLTDFTEKFLVETMQKNNFMLRSLETASDNKGVIIYDFRKVRG